MKAAIKETSVVMAEIYPRPPSVSNGIGHFG